MIDLKDKVALVTGGTRGIGQAIVLKLAEAGARVFFTGRSEKPDSELMQMFSDRGAEVRYLQGDIAVFSKCQDIIDQIIQDSGKIDILVNNAGITQDKLFLKMKPEDWNQVINTNLTGVFNTCKAVIKPMIKARYGRVINISSIVGHTGNMGQVNYASSKAGITGFTKSFAKEVATRKVTCNSIAPGFIQTDMTEKLPDTEKDKLNASIPMRRMGTAEEISNGVLFLASSLADYITGTTLHINGGMY
ncbi:MAG: 3-oxoacyl-ACP reductase FabG [Proteobacteria bacterium]|nr:3-oxoacyl-ACP reductase FabG [Pseudomonadota bacterium]